MLWSTWALLFVTLLSLSKCVLAGDTDVTVQGKGTVVSLTFRGDSQVFAAAEVDGGIGFNNQWDAPGGVNKTVQVRHVPDGAVVQSLNGHSHLIWSVAYSGDGILSTASQDNTIKLWKSDGSLIRTIQSPTNSSKDGYAGVQAVAFSADGKIVAGSGVDTTWLWGVADGTLLQTLHTQKSGISFSHNGELLVSRDKDGTVQVWRVADGKMQRSIPQSSTGICSPVFTNDDQALISCLRDGSITVWDVSTGARKTTIKGHNGGTWCIAVSPDGKSLVSAGVEGQVGSHENVQPLSSVRIWRLSNGELLKSFQSASGFIRSLAVSPDGKWIASGDTNGTIHLRNMPAN